MPGADIGLRAEDPTIATALKSLGYATGQFGKNHFGDRDEFLPTAHGFDEFFGNLYHLNAEEEPELDDYPTEEDFPDFRKNFGPRGVIHSWANAGRHPAHRGHRAADEGADEDHRRRGRSRGAAVHDRRQGERHPVLRLAEHHAHALPHPHQGRQQGQGRPLAVGVPRHDVRPRRAGRLGAGLPRRERPRREHDRHVLHRQRAAHEQLAGRRHDAVPQREELELGGRLPGAGDGPLARAHPGRTGAQRHRQPRRLVRHPARGCRRHRRRRPAEGGHRAGRYDVQGAPRRPQPARLRHRSRRREPAPALLLRLRRR